ncbi:MAG: amino acid permease, partial [Arenimonas sp.]|nr:amino acid permease [Arenimonas sp.]
MAPKKIGVLLATFVVANNMIGSGFFLLPASLASQGSVTALSWLVGTVIAVVLGGAFARLARDYPNLNCPDDYVRPALGRDMGFLATTLYWAASWAGNNAVAVAAFGYLVILLPLDGNDTAVRLGGQLALIWLMLAINLAGPRRVATFQSLCVVLGLLPVAVVLLGGWTRFDPALFAVGWNVTGTSDTAVVFGNLAPVFWSFIGLETGAMVAGIVDDPDR